VIFRQLKAVLGSKRPYMKQLWKNYEKRPGSQRLFLVIKDGQIFPVPLPCIAGLLNQRL